jgi:hypothetical protein
LGQVPSFWVFPTATAIAPMVEVDNLRSVGQS